MRELTEINVKTAKIKGNMARDRTLIEEQQSMIADKHKAISKMSSEIQEMTLYDVQVERKRNDASRLAEELENERFEREKLEQQLQNLNPFVGKEQQSVSVAQQIDRLKLQVREEGDECKRLANEDSLMQAEIRKLKERTERAKGERDLLQKQKDEAAD